jgi:hypothetical protein
MSPIEHLFPVVPLSPESLPCSVLPDGPLSPIKLLFPVEPLSPEILLWSRIGTTGNKSSIGDKGPFINTEQGKISYDKGSTGNKCYIGDKDPSINTEQGKISDDKGPTGNKVLVLTNMSINTKQGKISGDKVSIITC